MSSYMPSGFFNAASMVLDADPELEYFMKHRMGDSRRELSKFGVVLPVPTKFWGFFFNGCVYESSAALVSLHVTKRGALRAMIAHQRQRWEEALDPPNTGEHMDGYNGRKVYYDLLLSNTRSEARFVRAVEVEQS